ncbi:MAG: carotenoid biosynthesis protein [candidate division KSB1 bacterium]|nr:carotenoid biosynthesis protein [candidate division KSB1 bacterium]
MSVALLYTLLLAGGLWHALGIFQQAMQVLAAPMIAALGLFLFFDSLLAFRASESRRNPQDRSAQQASTLSAHKFVLWTLLVFLGGFFVEWVGVKSGAIFGSYVYSATLQPAIGGVPIAIGFAWFNMTMSAAAVSQRLVPARYADSPPGMALVIALAMVVFDFLMEPAAEQLNYWSWREGIVPIRNYFAWFVCGYFFSYVGLRLGLLVRPLSPIAVHAYVAQLFYFAMVNLF